MTVADLIRELQRMPQSSQVRVVPSSVWLRDESGDGEIVLSDGDATEADDVRNMGPWVLICGK